MNDFAKLTAALILLAALRWCFVPHSRLPRFRVKYTQLRLFLRLHPGRGQATVGELHLRWSRLAAFGRSSRSRRSLLAWQRLTEPDQHSLLLGSAHYGHRLRIPVEEHALVMAPPRTGKTGLLAKLILHYPGPVVSTTTKADAFELTSGIRATRGPIKVFNPQNIGGVPSTFRWNPIDGCEDEAVAIRRADGFANAVSLNGTENASFWSSKASSYLRGLFHAAALIGGDMRLVVARALGSAEDAEEILAQAGAVQWALELGELRGEAERTAATIMMVLSRALAFMTDPKLMQSVLPVDDEPEFDIASFLRQRGTLYLIAESEHDDSPVAPLFAAMAGEIHHVAAQLGQAQPGGRLDPPLLMALDEIVQTCPVPPPHLARGLRRQGHPAHPGRARRGAVAHPLAARRRTGRPRHLRRQDLATRHLRHRDAQDGQRVVRPGCPARTRPASPQPPRRHDAGHDPPAARRARAIIRGGYSPVLARLGAAWKDRAYKAARRRGTAVAALTPAPAARPALITTPIARPTWPEQPLRAAADQTADAATLGAASDNYPWSWN